MFAKLISLFRRLTSPAPMLVAASGDDPIDAIQIDLDAPARAPRVHNTLRIAATQLLPRMVARIGAATFTNTEPDYIDELPELRTTPRVITATEAEQIEALAQRVRAHAAQFRPDPASFPALAMRVMNRAQDRKAGVDQIVSLVAQDVAVSAAVLRVANSPMYRRGEAVHNIKLAVHQVGLEEVRRIAAGVASRSLYDMEVVSEFQLFQPRWNALFHRSMTVAFTSGWLASQLKVGAPERVFLGGMFHDIGKTIALRSLSALMMSGHVPEAPPDVVIDGMLEAVHVELGVAMHEAWGLPEELSLICRMHHDAALAGSADLAELHIVRLCSSLDELLLDSESQCGPAPRPSAAEVVRGTLRVLNLQMKQYRLLTAREVTFAEQVSTLFGIARPAVARAGADAKRISA